MYSSQCYSQNGITFPYTGICQLHESINTRLLMVRWPQWETSLSAVLQINVISITCHGSKYNNLSDVFIKSRGEKIWKLCSGFNEPWYGRPRDGFYTSWTLPRVCCILYYFILKMCWFEGSPISLSSLGCTPDTLYIQLYIVISEVPSLL